MVEQEITLDQVVSLSKRRGFIFQSSEIYGGMGACWDYGPLGVELKQNVKTCWWDYMVRARENVVGMDGSILMHPEVWVASGHVDGFHDPMSDCKECKARIRPDQFTVVEVRDEKGKVVETASFETEDPEAAVKECREKFRKELRRLSEPSFITHRMEERLGPCPYCGGELTEPRQFNLMFKTHVGAVEGEGSEVYLRPETAQAIFVNFRNIQQTTRQRIPFGIAQIGKAFRNEIVTKAFIFRSREFEQMEMQFFIPPEEDEKWYQYWKDLRMRYYSEVLGVSSKRLRWEPHPADKLAHYAKAAADIVYDFPMGWQEIEGVHNRGDFDLSQHASHSGKDMSYRDPVTNRTYVPKVIETSAGVDRCVLMLLCSAYSELEEIGEGHKRDTRTVLQFHPRVAPTMVAVFPLSKKTELVEPSHRLEAELRGDGFRTAFDVTGAIGKRYRRQDEVGTPFCVTFDFDSLQDGAVTIRHRDTMEQDRVALDKVAEVLRTKMKSWDGNIG